MVWCGVVGWDGMCVVWFSGYLVVIYTPPCKSFHSKICMCICKKNAHAAKKTLTVKAFILAS